jgi:hypothetical protein
LITVTGIKPGMDSAIIGEHLANFLHTQGLQVELAGQTIQHGNHYPRRRCSVMPLLSLSDAPRRLNDCSALAAVLHDAVENINRANEDVETAHIEMVLMTLNYDLAYLAEEIEKFLEGKA